MASLKNEMADVGQKRTYSNWSSLATSLTFLTSSKMTSRPPRGKFTSCHIWKTYKCIHVVFGKVSRFRLIGRLMWWRHNQGITLVYCGTVKPVFVMGPPRRTSPCALLKKERRIKIKMKMKTFSSARVQRNFQET